MSHELSRLIEYIESNGKVDILGNASIITDDIILELLDSENNVYIIDNYLYKAELLSQRLTRNLSKYLKPHEVASIRVALREIIINSIEHGNFNITFEEKTQVMAEDRYLQFIHERQNNPKYSNKMIRVEYSLNNERVIFKITDEGEGFDHEHMIQLAHDMLNGNDVLSHGRGLVMTIEAFDEVKFNQKGNQILVVKYFKIPSL